MSSNSSPLTPDEIDHYDDTRKPLLIGSFVVLLVLSNSAVIARGAGHWTGWRHFLLEDYLIFIALIISDAIIAGSLAGTSLGLGLHTYRVLESDPHPPQHLISIFKIIWYSVVLNGSCFLAIKLSILYTYRRLFLVNQRWLKIAWWANVLYAILWALGSTLFYILQCAPVNYYWQRVYITAYLKTPTTLPGHCESDIAKTTASLLTSTVSDFAILLLPVSVLYNLQIPTKQKLRLLLLFSLGLCACAAGVVRIALAFKMGSRTDATWDLTEFVIWCSVEECIGIICACIPTLASLFQRLARPATKKSSSSQTGTVLRPRYRTVDDDDGGCGDRESLCGFRGEEGGCELQGRGDGREGRSRGGGRGDKWDRKVEILTPERAQHHHPLQVQGNDIKVDTELEWRSDRLST